MKILRKKTLRDIKLLMIAHYVMLVQFEGWEAMEKLCEVAFDVFGFDGSMEICEIADKRLEDLLEKRWREMEHEQVCCMRKGD